MNKKVNVFWFRRDLRLTDNHGLFRALKADLPVLPIFIFDTKILDKLYRKADARVDFIYKKVKELKEKLELQGSSLKVFYSTPEETFSELLKGFDIDTVYTNKDYEPYGIDRDKKVGELLERAGVGFQCFNDHVIFEPGTITKNNNEPYTVYTPYSKKWLAVYQDSSKESYPSENFAEAFFKTPPFQLPELADLGFSPSNVVFPELKKDEQLIENYEKFRDIPSINGTSKLGVHLRFGTISIRELTALAHRLSETFLKELIWRNFFIDILWHFPYVVEKAFKNRYDFIEWRNDERDFECWCEGKTGYPMVDAGMRELNATGFMHNRVRMVVASFLTKHLLIDWRWGEAYFAEKLLDYELASNNGNWQWAAGCGCDAAPYFRVFNPETQQKKFDPEGKYIHKWIPELGTVAYPSAIVDHKTARERALSTYKKALK
ncbi:deoxyribodipyrimidine photo-lyase [Prolixibacteraceae bacterium Z1-6]|uniref:Deoxyribodipyrimidine photo-lyase n=1 Tax=Draconibacterium aestuarii TaxID=2998507 RepID=A0A9X3F709_9BACT|nr:deoxyribodipyrimidine photo-lyase [Prolixibacteraceae bacterium Z1-6]